MACACKVNKQLDYIQKKYGYDRISEKNKNKKLDLSPSAILSKIGTSLIIAIASPFMIGHILYHGMAHNNKPIDIAKTFGLKNSARR